MGAQILRTASCLRSLEPLLRCRHRSGHRLERTWYRTRTINSAGLGFDWCTARCAIQQVRACCDKPTKAVWVLGAPLLRSTEQKAKTSCNSPTNQTSDPSGTSKSSSLPPCLLASFSYDSQLRVANVWRSTPFREDSAREVQKIATRCGGS